jgi:hypothetical protein
LAAQPDHHGSIHLPRWYFNCSGPGFEFPDEFGEWLPDLEAAQKAAARLSQALVERIDRDWQDWAFRIADDEGQTRLIYLVTDAHSADDGAVITPQPPGDGWLL